MKRSRASCEAAKADVSLPRLTGAALLLDLLGEDHAAWREFLREKLTERDLASDQAIERWIEREIKADPALVTKMRHVLSAFREDVISAPFQRILGIPDTEGGH